MNAEAGPALRWPIRLLCGALGTLISSIAWEISATWPGREHSPAIRALVALMLGAPFLVLAVLGAGQAVLVPEGGEEVLEAEWERAHPWRARLTWGFTIANGAYGAVRAGEVLAAGQRIPVDGIAACVIGILMTGGLIVRWRGRHAGGSRQTRLAPRSLRRRQASIQVASASAPMSRRVGARPNDR